MTDIVPLGEPMTPEQLQKILAGAGAIDEKNDSYGATRMKVNGNTFQTDDNVWMSNPKSEAPAFTARLMSPPEQYQAFWFDDAAAERAGRPEMAGRMCKSYYDNPQEARDYGTNGAPCRSCLFKPFGDERPKCGWKGDLRFQIFPEDGELKGDEPLHEITFSVTGMIEFRGTAREPQGGSATDMNFITKLGYFAAGNPALEYPGLWSEWGVTPGEAVGIALEALNEGLVVAGFRIAMQSNQDKSRTWPVVVLDPVHVERPETGTTAIPAGTTVEENNATAAPTEDAPKTHETVDSDLPF